MTGEIQKHTEAEVTRWHQLKDVIRRNKADAMEWIKAVKEAQQTALWMLQYATWDEFCQQELGMPARAVGHELHIGQSGAAQQPKLPALITEGFGEMKDNADRMGARLKSFLKLYVELTADWPESELSPVKLREMDEDLLRWAGGFEIWLSSQSSICEASRKLGARVKARGKRRKKV